jgi:hypothetical protein
MINTAASRIAALRRSGLKFWEEGRLEEAAECLAAAAAAAPRDATRRFWPSSEACSG